MTTANAPATPSTPRGRTQEDIAPMSHEASQDVVARARQRDERRKTKHRGISYREIVGGRSYYVFWRSKYILAGKTEREALALQSELRSRKAKGERVVVASKRTVREVGEAWYEAERSGWREEYAREQRRYLDREIFEEFGDDRVSAIGPHEVIAHDRKLRARGLSASGAANIQKPLRGLLDHAVLAGDITVSPYRQIPKGKLSSCNARREHHEWTTEEVAAFIAAAYAHDEGRDAGRSYGLQVETMIRLGLRIGEASGLRYSDIDRKAKTIDVRRQFTKRGQVVEYTKTASSRRRIPVTDELLAKLDFRQSLLGLADDDFLFAEEPGGNPPSHSNFRRRAWNLVVAKTGLQLEEGVRLTPHDSRHATASQPADLDLDSDDVAALLGHSSAKVTEAIYVHSFDADRREQRIREAMARAQNGGAS
jgi:integrase